MVAPPTGSLTGAGCAAGGPGELQLEEPAGGARWHLPGKDPGVPGAGRLLPTLPWAGRDGAEDARGGRGAPGCSARAVRESEKVDGHGSSPHHQLFQHWSSVIHNLMRGWRGADRTTAPQKSVWHNGTVGEGGAGSEGGHLGRGGGACLQRGGQGLLVVAEAGPRGAEGGMVEAPTLK